MNDFSDNHPRFMKRFATALLLVAAFGLAAAPQMDAQTAEAQTPSWKHQVVFNSGPQFATGDVGENLKTGLAIDVGYYYRAADAFFVGVFGGYHQFAGEGNTLDADIIPLNLAFKYNFSLTGIQPYVGAEGGAFVVSRGSDNSETNLGIAPRLGVRVPLSEGIDLDLNVKYNVIFQDETNFTYVGANGGFAYILDRANIQYR
jgi:hypothetical protein